MLGDSMFYGRGAGKLWGVFHGGSNGIVDSGEHEVFLIDLIPLISDAAVKVDLNRHIVGCGLLCY